MTGTKGGESSADVRNPSLWMATTDASRHPTLPGDERADVVVIGAGITGLTTARLLASEGASVTVTDAGEVCAGATGYTTAKITSLHGLTHAGLVRSFGEDRTRVYAEANQASIELVAQLIAQDSIDCGFERRAHVAYTVDGELADAIADEAAVATRIGLPASLHVPTELPFEVAAAVRFDHQAQFHPRAYRLALAVHRDDDGTRRAVSAVCTHLGCLVSFNPVGAVWDCPCHGSRFDVEGHVLEGPAVDDLDPRER